VPPNPNPSRPYSFDLEIEGLKGIEEDYDL